MRALKNNSDLFYNGYTLADDSLRKHLVRTHILFEPARLMVSLKQPIREDIRIKFLQVQ